VVNDYGTIIWIVVLIIFYKIIPFIEYVSVETNAVTKYNTTYTNKHIQFLYSLLSRDNANDDWLLYGRGHWVCSYYDRKNIFIYDSLNNKRLENNYRIMNNF